MFASQKANYRSQTQFFFQLNHMINDSFLHYYHLLFLSRTFFFPFGKFAYLRCEIFLKWRNTKPSRMGRQPNSRKCQTWVELLSAMRNHRYLLSRLDYYAGARTQLTGSRFFFLFFCCFRWFPLFAISALLNDTKVDNCQLTSANKTKTGRNKSHRERKSRIRSQWMNLIQQRVKNEKFLIIQFVCIELNLSSDDDDDWKWKSNGENQKMLLQGRCWKLEGVLHKFKIQNVKQTDINWTKQLKNNVQC